MAFKNTPQFVALLAAILFIPFLGNVHLFDWDEVNFAESAREMLVTGDYFRVQINYQPFWEKPPLFFWLQALSMSVFGVNEFAARFPNAICGILSLTLLFQIGKQTFNPRFAWIWVLFMAGSFTPALYFKTGIIDPWFNLFIFYAIWQLSLVSRKTEINLRTKRFLFIGISLGLAVLTKGPVALLVVGLCSLVVLFRNGFYLFFNFKQIAIMMICIVSIASLWVVLEISKNGFGVLVDFINYQIDLFRNPVAGHGQPWYYHPVVLLIGCFPASIIAIPGFFSKTTSVEESGLKQWMNALFWCVLILFSVVTTKIVHYSSLCWMPLTFMAAFTIEKRIQNQQTLPKSIILFLGLIGFFIGIVLTAIPLIESYKIILIPYIQDSFAKATLDISASWLGFEPLLGMLFLLILTYVMIQFWKNELAKGLYTLMCFLMLFIPVYLIVVVPKIEQYSQQSAINFYKSLVGKDCYVETLGMKSYAQYFYSKTLPHINSKSYDEKWLLHSNEIDKPVYFVSKIGRLEEIATYGPIEIGRKGGFVFWKREPILKDTIVHRLNPIEQ
jgi:4-amino-4-deoxy-L-arabinose transferase-like glycosyltransferase